MGVRTPRRPRHRYIPFRKRDIVEMCIATSDMAGTEQMQFREFCEMLQSVFHFEYHKRLEDLKDAYAPLNPDRDTRKVGILREDNQNPFVDQLEELLDRANYEQLGEEALQYAFSESSLFRLKLDVNFDDFSEVLLFTRGESEKHETVSTLFGLIKKPITFSNFDRVVIYIRFSDDIPEGAAGYRPGATMLKLFQNVPRADIEMLFPNTRVGMRLIDKLMIGVPAVVGGGIILTTKLGASLVLLASLFGFWLGLHSKAVELDEAALIALVAGIGGLGSFIWRQFVNFKNRKLTFMQALTQNLYFKNLDNNAGVFHRLIDDAEEEDCKEAILATYFLQLANSPVTAEALDASIETWFVDRWQGEIDFEIGDALDKLAKLGLAKCTDGLWQAVDLATACEILDRRWDGYFTHANPVAVQ